MVGNKDLVLHWLDAMNRAAYAEAFTLVDEAAQFWMLGDGPGGGVFSKAERYEAILAGAKMFPSPPQFEIVRIVADAGLVVVEARVEQHLKAHDGALIEYRQNYCQIFEVNNGLIVNLRVYWDTALAARVLALVAGKGVGGAS